MSSSRFARWQASIRQLPQSLRGRLLMAATMFLVLFSLLTALILEAAFASALRSQIELRLQSHIYTLLSVAEEAQPGELYLPAYLRDERFNQLDSGFYAMVLNSEGERIWRSNSVMPRQFPAIAPGKVGEIEIQEIDNEGESFIAASFPVIWEGIGGSEYRYQFVAIESESNYAGPKTVFQQTLWIGMSVLVVVLVFVLTTIMRWGLKPLKAIARAMNSVEKGEASQLVGDFPAELQPMIDNINLFIRSEHAQKKRYADTMANLAHSLKTPLAVLRGATESDADIDKLRRQVHEQVSRMHDIVRYQLHKAVTKGRRPFASIVRVDTVTVPLVDALRKVYRDKHLEINAQVASACRFAGEEGDLTEILGNLMDNACKWSKSRVELQAKPLPDTDAWTEFVISDDGPGIAEEKRLEVLERGKRLDTQVEGQGIGLSVIVELVHAYDGEMHIGTSTWGGAEVKVVLPARNLY
ncbi:ATP-binding protein [Permianibacter aggregans]|uniref:histidine kinase n=1 Tax=Permianibacter aggregans TaxID=1510150 RepID=A0A4R6UVG3_9GAMM|nr:ATP-binding protein [Permianibacter aggregans]TDQ51211.1 two-component system sensor histidine kinase PhoQ [Permianibacter aggregans]